MNTSDRPWATRYEDFAHKLRRYSKERLQGLLPYADLFSPPMIDMIRREVKSRDLRTESWKPARQTEDETTQERCRLRDDPQLVNAADMALLGVSPSYAERLRWITSHVPATALEEALLGVLGVPVVEREKPSLERLCGRLAQYGAPSFELPYGVVVRITFPSSARNNAVWTGTLDEYHETWRVD